MGLTGKSLLILKKTKVVPNEDTFNTNIGKMTLKIDGGFWKQGTGSFLHAFPSICPTLSSVIAHAIVSVGMYVWITNHFSQTNSKHKQTIPLFAI